MYNWKRVSVLHLARRDTRRGHWAEELRKLESGVEIHHNARVEQVEVRDRSEMWYFAYGSNLNARAVAEWCRHYSHRCPNLKAGKPALLDNYRLCFPIFSEYWQGGIGDIVYDPGKYVAGALFNFS